MKQIRIYAMKRSGHHAIINWICRQIDNSFDIQKNYFEKWNKKNFILFSNDVLSSKEVKKYLKNSIDYSAVNACIWIYNIEEETIENSISKLNFLKKICPFDMENTTEIIVLRDAFNLFASRDKNSGYEMRVNCEYSINNFLKIWKNHAKEFLRITKILKNPIGINYNEWFTNRDYRAHLCEKININFNDNGINDVTFFGGGSSFDHVKHDKNAQKMDVLNRYKNISSFPFFDKETIELNKLLFPNINVKLFI
jgi:hypothetical protein